MVLFSCTSQQKKDRQANAIPTVSESVRIEHYDWKPPKYKTVKAYMVSNDLACCWTRERDGGKRNFFERIKREKNVVLSKTQVEKTETLFTTTVSDSLYSVADCFTPRHIIVYHDNKGEMTAAILVCYDCSKTEVFPAVTENLNIYTENFRALFQEVGFPVFDNPLQHQAHIDSLKFLKKN